MYTHLLVAEILGSRWTGMKESSVTCNVLAGLLNVVESLVMVSDVLILDHLVICKTS